MGVIGIDLTQTPDRRLIVKAGVYQGVILGVEIKPPAKPETKGSVLHIPIRIVNHETEADREVTAYVFIPAESKRADGYTAVKRLFMSAGVQIRPQGMDTNELVGKMVTFSVTNGIDKDERSGVVRETYGVGEFFIPTDNVRVGQSLGGSVPGVDPSIVLGGAVTGQQPGQPSNGPYPAMQQPPAQQTPNYTAMQQQPQPQPAAPQVFAPQGQQPQQPAPAFRLPGT